MAGGAGGDTRAYDRQLISAVEWMRKQGEPVDEDMWAAILAIAKTARRASVRLAAYREFTARFDPIPKQLEAGETTRPVNVIIGVVTPAEVRVNGRVLDAGSPVRTDGLRLSADGGNGEGP